jgi:FkbM family methyltransferase
MQLSYAQNLEDHHLELLFADVRDGVYVDVGGGHPVADNVSFYFYLKGWRGLVVEPQKALAGLYAHVRPRDVTLSLLAGREDGTAQFHTVDKLHGLSSMVEASAANAQTYGVSYATETKPVRRLSTLLAYHGFDKIDFLKIDVEGAEDQVLAGMDWSKHRPRVVVIEAVNPGSTDTSAAFEPQMLKAGYKFAFFDNLNRFYVADEAAALAKRLPKVPTPWHDIPHLFDCGLAPVAEKHPDHVLAKALMTGFFASLPALDPTLLRCLIERGLGGTGGPDQKPEALAAVLFGSAEYPGRDVTPKTADWAALMATDRFRAALGRIACTYDGGHIMD